MTVVKEIQRLPPDLSKPSQELDDYLSTLKESCMQDQIKQIRYAKMTRTRHENALTKLNIVEVPSNRRTIIACNTLEDSSIVVEKRVGYRVICPRCNWSWIWHGKKDRFFISCSRCHKSFKLNWK